MSAEGMVPGRGFEGGWLADGLSDDAVLECGVCWRVYDPKAGEPHRGVKCDTPFSALPEDWRCPECDSAKAQFLLVSPGSGPRRGPQAQTMQSRLDALLAAYRDADLAMSTLPIYNPKLKIAAIGFRPHADGYVGALVTPWFLNLVYLPAQKDITVRPNGAVRTLVFPAGAFVFSAVKLERVGAFEFCSLFSPMLEFEDHPAARLAAEAAIEALFTPAPQTETPKPEQSDDAPSHSRRTLLLGRSRQKQAPA